LALQIFIHLFLLLLQVEAEPLFKDLKMRLPEDQVSLLLTEALR